MSGADSFLPGFERLEDVLADVPVNITDEEIDKLALRRFPEVTLKRIESERPDLVKMVARAFFNLGLSLRNISYITGIHRDTISAIIAKHNSTDEIKSVRKSKAIAVHQLGNIAIMRLRELLMDDKAVQKAGISGILDVARKLDEMETAIASEINGNTVDAPTPSHVIESKEIDAESYLG